MALAEAPVIPGQQELVSAAPSHPFSDSIEAALKRAEGKSVPSKDFALTKQRLVAFTTNAKIEPPDDDTIDFYYKLRTYGYSDPKSEPNGNPKRVDIGRLSEGAFRDFVNTHDVTNNEIIHELRFGVNQLSDTELYALTLDERGRKDQLTTFIRANAPTFARRNYRIYGTEASGVLIGRLLKLSLAETLHTPNDLDELIQNAQKTNTTQLTDL